MVVNTDNGYAEMKEWPNLKKEALAFARAEITAHIKKEA